MTNDALKPVYDRMHSEGPKAWFSDGENERKLILEMGEPWNMDVIEVGCGEGDLGWKIHSKRCEYIGVDYSESAYWKLKKKYPKLSAVHLNYRRVQTKHTRLVLQGVIEHLDDPFTELKWMMDNLLAEKGDVITSSPCFQNARGVIWMTLNMLGAVMSKTDLHCLEPLQFSEFCQANGYTFQWQTTDYSWANDKEMILDLKQRIPLALKDGGIPFDQKRFDEYMGWLERSWVRNMVLFGATAVYRITK